MSKKAKIEKRHLTAQDIDDICRTIRTSRRYLPNRAGEFMRARDQTIIKLCSLCALRPSEALMLKWSDIDFDNKLINIEAGTNKENQGNNALLIPQALEILYEYKQVYDQYLAAEFLFPSLVSFEPLTLSAFDKIFLKIQKEAGLYKVLWYTSAGQPISSHTPYDLRKHAGTRFYRHTRDPYKTMRFLRQKKMTSIIPYLHSEITDIYTDAALAFS